MLTQQHSERSIDFEMGRKPYCGPGRLGCWGLGDRPGPGAAIRGAPMLQTNNRAAGSKVREVRQFWTTPTVGELQRRAWLWCERCQHHAPLACAVAVILSGPDASGDKLRAGARCTCGGKGATRQRPGWAGNHIGFYPFPTVAD
jgi:hypothetical protein